MLSLFFKWSCFYGWCSAVDIYWGLMQVLYLDWHLSWVTTLTYFMTRAPRTWRTMCSKLRTPGQLPVLLASSVPAISKGSWIFWASSFLSIKRRKLMEWFDDFFLHWNTFMIRYETLRCHGRRSELEIRAETPKYSRYLFHTYYIPDPQATTCYASANWSNLNYYLERKAVNETKREYSIEQESWIGIKGPCFVLPCLCIILDKSSNPS